MKTTIRDVARESGVSTATVSLILNNKGHRFPEETRNRVQAVAASLDYRPNQIAVSLVKQRSRTLGMIVPDIGNHYFAKLVKSVEEEARNHGFNIILCNSNDDKELEANSLRVLMSKGVDGILLCIAQGSSAEDEKMHLEIMEKNRISYCIIDRYFKDVGKYGVCVDHEYGAKLAVEYLISLGHKRIGCVTGPMHSGESVDRLSGYKSALNKHGFMFDERLVFNGNYGWQKGRESVDILLKENVTAIFAFNDLSAMGVMTGLREAGKKVPYDISVVGFDDSDYSLIYDVPLTTIHQPLEKVAFEAIKSIQSQLESKSPKESQLKVRPHLVIRNSASECSY